MGLVATWLNGIGLTYAVPSFVAAGIDTPEALAELSVSHFEALGVTDAEDRRKLFFLVQRIKMAVEKHDDSVVSQVDAVLAQTADLSSPSRKNAELLTEEEPDDDDEESAQEKENNDSDWAETEDTGGDSADDEASSVPDDSLLPRRQSKRLLEKQRHSKSETKTAAVRRQSSLLKPTAGKRSTTSLSRRRKSDTTAILHRPIDPDTSDTSTNSKPRRLSGVPMPKGRTRKHLSKSMRTGKQLSSIPSNSVAPMSPLVDLTSAKLAQAPDLPYNVTSRRRSGSFETTSDSDSSSSQRRRRSELPKSRSSSVGSWKESSASGTAKRTDHSFATHIQRLRDDNNADYELFDRPSSPTTSQQQQHDDMRIRVVVRKRPMSNAEVAVAGNVDVLHTLRYAKHGKVLVYNPKTRVDLTKSVETIPFCLDNVFDEDATNVQIYEQTVRPLIPSLFEGQWATIFAYGQTGSGKTFTMMGSSATTTSIGAEDAATNLGLYYMAALDLFQAMQTAGFEDYSLSVSLFEIYSGKLFDLLNDRSSIKCLEDSNGRVCFPGLTEHDVSSADDLMALIQDGARNRSTGTTSRNADSSRSHAVLQLHLRNENSNSRLTFIDLAGSERGADTATASRATRLEGAEINTSLLALKEVIRALATGDSLAHVPFRGSKLTQVLKESFVGPHGRSVMIACVSPNIGNVETTLNTLRYADRIKERNAETGELSIPKETTSLPLASNHSSSQNNTSDLLDEILGTPPGKSLVEEPPDVASQLIAQHKTVMTTLLTMIKDEMTLVNQADSDRESLGEYVKQLSEIHHEQLSYITSLRELLLSYRLSSPRRGGEDDDSFEDLRD